MLPLSSAILAVIGLYYFVGHWNDFMTGLIYITDDTKQPLQVVLQQLLLVAQGTGTNVNAAAQQQAADRSSSASSSSPPCLCWCCTRSCRRYFNKGVMLGAVKLIERDSPCSLVFPWPMNGSAVCCSRSSW